MRGIFRFRGRRGDGGAAVILSSRQQELLGEESRLLDRLTTALDAFPATDDDREELRRAKEQLGDLFLLVIVGEFNAGKSAFINALLAAEVMPEGVTPTTSVINLLRYGDEPSETMLPDGVIQRTWPSAMLDEITIVDTPGTNAIIREHEQLTQQFVPRADMVLFVTSADRPFSESERAFLQQIREWGKKIVIVLNKVDLLDEVGLAEVERFIRENAARLLGFSPEIFPVAAKLAQRAKEMEPGPERDALWARSRFAALERYILDSLDSSERIRLKLENPLGIAAKLIDKYRAVIADRQALLRGDFGTLDTIEEQLEAYRIDMHRDFQYQSSRVDNVLYEMMERGDRYFDETLRVTRLFDLVNTEKLRGEFERQVVADTSRKIEQHVGELIDWLVEKDYRQWQSVMEFIHRRSSQHTDRMVGEVRGEFELNRQKLLSSVGRSAREVVDSYDREAEALKLAQDVQRTIVQTAAVEVGALGLGALLVALLQTIWLDITGILGASAIAALGLYVLPYRRGRIKEELRERINELRERLDAALTRQFDAELDRSIQRIREAIAPYTRFVRVEREKLTSLEEALEEASAQLNKLRRETAELG